MITRQAKAAMNTRYGTFEVVAFETDAGRTHLGLVKGAGQIPLVRIQSHCLTSTAFHSTMCDCAEQVNLALHMMSESDYAIMVYLDQEARGHGLLSKIEVMRFLNRGLDIAEAQRAAGKSEDRRDYSDLPEMLQALGVTGPIDLLTNNPAKVEAFGAMGLEIRNRIPLLPELGTREQKFYFQTKQAKLGHWSSGE